MSEITRILHSLDAGDPKSAEELLPLVYAELRKLAAIRMAREKPGQTIQATALVHDAYLRLVDGSTDIEWNSRGHFFGAAAEAMRRLLIEQARRKQSAKAGGEWTRIELPEVGRTPSGQLLDLIALDDALQKLEREHPRKAELIKLRFFAGLTIEQAAAALDVAPSTVSEDWAYAKSWLKLEMESGASA